MTKNKMSKFRIYSSRNTDPVKVGKRNRIAVVFFTIFGSMFYAIYISIKQNISERYVSLILILFCCFIGILLGLVIYYSTRIKQIGVIDFHQSGIIKKIGELKEFWPIDMLDEIFLKRHLRKFSGQDFYDNVKTYMMKVRFNDKKEQKFIIDSYSVDHQDVSIKNVLNILEGRTKIKIRIK